MRVVDVAAPMVHRSITVGFDQQANGDYVQRGVAVDPFREALASGPLGVIQASHQLIADRDFARSAHYEHVFRPNGNFYAMGAHFDRTDASAMHIGIHRPRHLGPFDAEERNTLQFFSPHLRRVARLTRRIRSFETALEHAHAVLDDLAFGVWIVDHQLHCRWANAPAEDAMRSGACGLRMSRQRLVLDDAENAGRLRAAVKAIDAGGLSAQTVCLGETGAALVVVQYVPQTPEAGLASTPADTLLVFLFDPTRPTPLDDHRLAQMHDLTPAELRLLREFMRGLDVNESSARLGISIHTARTQMKAIMQKVGVNRQAELMRRLLLSAACSHPARD